MFELIGITIAIICTMCDMGLMKCLIISFSDLERHVVAEDEKLYLKEKGITTDEIQGIRVAVCANNYCKNI